MKPLGAILLLLVISAAIGTFAATWWKTRRRYQAKTKDRRELLAELDRKYGANHR